MQYLYHKQRHMNAVSKKSREKGEINRYNVLNMKQFFSAEQEREIVPIFLNYLLKVKNFFHFEANI